MIEILRGIQDEDLRELVEDMGKSFPSKMFFVCPHEEGWTLLTKASEDDIDCLNMREFALWLKMKLGERKSG